MNLPFELTRFQYRAIGAVGAFTALIGCGAVIAVVRNLDAIQFAVQLWTLNEFCILWFHTLAVALFS